MLLYPNNASEIVMQVLQSCMDNFHKVLKELRETKGMSQVQLGKALGYKSHSIIAQWESGKIIPDIANLIVIAKFFDVSIDYLVGLEK
jgi:transcriptional regulator with XRE-family HTH domain